MSTDTTGTPDAPPSREEVLADLVRLQALSRELGDLCQQALETRAALPVALLSEKAEESIRLVERLAGYASGQESLEQYRSATTRLEVLIAEVHAADDPEALQELQARAVESVNDWAAAVERVLEGVLSRARP